MVLPIRLVDLVERLRDEEAADAVAGHEGQRRLEEVQPPECRELVEHQQQLVAAPDAVGAVERFGEATPDLVEDQANERLRPRNVRRRHHQVQRYRMLGSDQIGDAPVAARRDFGHRGIAVQAEERHGRAQHAGTLVVRLVEHFARRRCNDRMRPIAEVRRGHHAVQGQLERTGRVGQEVGDAAQRLVFARVEHMQDGPDQQRVAGFFPMISLLQRALGIDEDVGDVLHVAHFMRAAPHFQQRVVGRRLRIGRVEQQTVAESAAPAGGDLPVLTLDVVDDGRGRPGQQRRHYQTDTFARARGREGQDVFRAFMPQVLAIVLAEEYAGRLRQARLANVLRIRPACRTVGGNEVRLARAPDRHADGDHHRQQAAAARDGAAGIEHARRVGVEEEPPLKQLPRVVDRRAEKIEPGRAKA
ncbi:hypothetical protein PAERUG_P64_East_of_England_6_01_14_03954 [Pseudomonas aeruginosa]|nr:hypothetical protein PAERUG_P64_East_of_England_6_01_14_03954 [Pseudomonas aeruginosa]